MKTLAGIYFGLTFAVTLLAGAPSLERTFEFRTEDDWFSARKSAKESLSQDDFARFASSLDWIESDVRKEYPDVRYADAVCAVLLDGRTVRQIIVLGAMLNLHRLIEAELENRALECESTDPDKKQLYRLRADEARKDQAVHREIIRRYGIESAKKPTLERSAAP